MTTKIVLVGAGGKMGVRITDNFLKCPQYDFSYLEISANGIELLKQRGVTTSAQDAVIPEADVVILGVPDVAIGKISHEIIPLMKQNALVITLDPAAPLDGII